MRVLLDTQILIIVARQGGIACLPKPVRAVLEDVDNELMLSAASAMEIVIKHAHKKLDFNQEDLELVCAQVGIEMVPLQKRHAVALYRLPMHHKDPFDRMIIATAIVEDIPVITGDREFPKYNGLKVIW